MTAKTSRDAHTIQGMHSARAALFQYKAVYDHGGSEALFMDAMRESIRHHQSGCDFYGRLLDSEGFNPLQLRGIEDLAAIPVTPVDFFKTHDKPKEVLSILKEAVAVHATSSGTSGQKSQVFLDQSSIDLGIKMIIKSMSYHGLISMLPTNYLLLGYQPMPQNSMGNVKILTGMTRFAPAIRKTFAFKPLGADYQLDVYGLLKALKRYSRMGLPVRILGFPFVLYGLLMALKSEGLPPIKLHPKSLVLTGGGWKQHNNLAIDKTELYGLVHSLLGIPPENCRDFYSAVEHSVAYPECRNHHMHVPIWSRVIIRDVKTLAPLGYDQPGFLNFVSPLVSSMPLSSVLMGDLAVLRDGSQCGCGITTPYFEVLGRAGTGKARSCAIAASELTGSRPEMAELSTSPLNPQSPEVPNDPSL